MTLFWHINYAKYMILYFTRILKIFNNHLGNSYMILSLVNTKYKGWFQVRMQNIYDRSLSFKATSYINNTIISKQSSIK